MRVGDRKAKKAVNEAASDHAGRPRLFFLPLVPFGRSGATRLRFGFFIAAVPVLLLLMTFMTFRTTAVRESPPRLQAFVNPPNKSEQSSPEKRKTPEPLIRVNVTPGGVDSFQLQVRGACDLVSLEPDKKLSEKAPSGTVTVTSTKLGLKLSSRQYQTNQLELTPEQSPSIRVNGHLYRGKMRLYRRTDGKVSAVNVLPLEDYLASVVDSEMPAKFPEAARRAQAIVARTYVLYQVQQANPNAVYDLLASQRSQKYSGVEYIDSKGRRLAGESDNSRRVVASTRGLVCKQHDKIFCTYYSAVCGGRTMNGRLVFKDAIDVLRSVPCEWCKESPHYRWTTEVTQDDFQKCVFSRGDGDTKKPFIHAIRQEAGPGEGVVCQFVIDDGQRRHSINGIELRERLPLGKLSSPRFSIKLEKDRVVFEGRGHGHGVGFCQWGAKGQAEAGRDHFEILRYYYPGAEIVSLED